jgi:hypothetical protein
MYYTGEDFVRSVMKVWVWVCLGAWLAAQGVAAQNCTTQSQMKDAERTQLAAAADVLATKMQANDTAGVRALTIADFQKDFSGMADAIAATASKLAGAKPEVDQIYILDATGLAKTGGTNPDAQFFCTLNQSPNEVEFAIPQLPPGRYAFAIVDMESAAPWRLSYLLRQEGSQWLLAGFYPKEMTAGGHDGLWYWKQSRVLSADKDQWDAWLYLEEAQALLLPTNFISSTHLDNLQTELNAAAPSAVSGGLSAETPLVVKGADGSEFRFTAIAPDDSLHADKLDVRARIKVDALGDAAAARKRNVDAAAALVAAHPELRKTFHGVWIYADAPGASPYATELAMAEIK